MVMNVWIALAGFAAASFASASGSRYVFCLLDSGFQVKSETETILANTAAPDTAAVQAKAQSLATWPSGVRLNTAAIDGVWMAFEPPADPGDVIFVSDTDPVRPFLVLRIDAMCQGCIHAYEAYGDSVIPRTTASPANDPVVSDLDERFGYGMKTSAEEKDSIARALGRWGLPPAEVPLQIHVLKPNSRFSSRVGISYIAYYRVPAPIAALHPLRAAAAGGVVSNAEVDALGRHVTGQRVPMKTLPRAYRTGSQGE